VVCASKEVFVKTLALFCALQEHGCLFDSEAATKNAFDESGDILEEDLSYDVLRDLRSIPKAQNRCKGKLIFFRDVNNQPLVQ
jgi:hypothetical protein